MHWMTEDARIVCGHKMGSRVTSFAPAQAWVTVAQRRVLVEPDPVGRSIVGCPNLPPMGKACTKTLPVASGYSDLVRIGGQRVCLDAVVGMTDGVAPVMYEVQSAAQDLVSASA